MGKNHTHTGATPSIHPSIHPLTNFCKMYTGDLIDYCARVCGYKNEYATDSTLKRLTFTLGLQVNRKEFQ